jgi:hypothetical protein
MFSVTSTGTPGKTEAYLARMRNNYILNKLDGYGRMGVAALSNATPVESGLSAHSWYYKISRSGGSFTIEWHNSHVTEDGVPVVILLQYGHGTGTGGYVQGRDFINPAMRPVMDQIAAEVWKVVTSA